MPRLVQFDLPRFRHDLKAWIDGEPYGVRFRVIRGAGIANGTLGRLLNGGTEVTDVETILSVCEFTGLSFDAYVLRGAMVRGQLIDWDLFRACASFYCGGSARELHRRTRVPYQVAQTALTHGIIATQHFERLLCYFGLKIEDFDPAWRRKAA